MVAGAAAESLVYLPGAVKSSPEVGRFWVVKRKGFSIVLFQVEASSPFPPGTFQLHMTSSHLGGPGDEVSEPFCWPP